MIRSKLGLKALGLCALILGLMAMSAGAAQAETGASWDVSGTKISEALLPGLGIAVLPLKGTELKHLVLLTLFNKKTLEILCSAATAVGVHLLAPNGRILGIIIFTGCHAFTLGGVEQKSCVPEKEEIETKKGKGLIVLNAAKTEGLTKLEPETGTEFAVIKLSPLCAIGEELPIGGNLVVKDANGKFTTSETTHSIEYDESSALWAISNTAEHKATIDGLAHVFLTGAHAGLSWNGLPA